MYFLSKSDHFPLKILLPHTPSTRGPWYSPQITIPPLEKLRLAMSSYMSSQWYECQHFFARITSLNLLLAIILLCFTWKNVYILKSHIIWYHYISIYKSVTNDCSPRVVCRRQYAMSGLTRAIVGSQSLCRHRFSLTFYKFFAIFFWLGSYGFLPNDASRGVCKYCIP